MKDCSYEILDLLKKYDGDVAAALAGETSPQCLYAFSPLRENLFEWVEFGKDARVLQVGSDYGSYTGLLAKRAGEVVVLDERDENLEVNRLRHGEKTNVRYVRGTLLASGGAEAYGQSAAEAGDVRFREYKPRTDAAETAEELMGRPFDYVVMAGFPEEFKKEDAAALLLAAAACLKPGGTLLSAAENEAGVRYWMGAAAFSPAFLEVEFRGMFEELAKTISGSFTMYYPVPDYRYPVTVYSDHYLPKTGDVTNISARLDGPGFWFGSEEEAMAKACQNGEFTKFANSFLGVFVRKA